MEENAEHGVEVAACMMSAQFKRFMGAAVDVWTEGGRAGQARVRGGELTGASSIRG